MGVGEEVEGHAVMGCGAVLLDGGPVGLGGVAFVLLPAVLGIVAGKGEHVVVTIGLGEDGGCCDAEIGGIAFNDGMIRYACCVCALREGRIGDEAVAVDDEVLGTQCELIYGTVHGKDGAAKDVELVDFFCRTRGNSPGEGIELDIVAQQITLAFGELLGVVEERMFIVLRQNDSSGIDGTGKTASTRLVAPCLDDIGGVERQKRMHLVGRILLLGMA